LISIFQGSKFAPYLYDAVYLYMLITERLLEAGICDLGDGNSYMQFERCWSFQGIYFYLWRQKYVHQYDYLPITFSPAHADPHFGQRIFSIHPCPLPAFQLCYK